MTPEDTSTEPRPDASEPDFKAVARVSKRIDLENVRLYSLHVEGNVDPGELPQTWATDAFVGLNAHRHGPAEDDPVSDGFCAHVSFLAVYKREHETPDEPPDYDPEDPPDLVIDATFELTYSVEESVELDSEDLDSFVTVNVPFQAWPYWRELAHSCCQRIGIAPPLIAPALKLPSKHDPGD